MRPQANFVGEALGLSSTSQALANHPRQVWNSGSSLNGGFSAMSAINTAPGLGSALNSIAGAAVLGVAATRQAASDRFFDNMVSCESLKPGASPFQEDNRGWMRVLGAQNSLASTDGDPGYHQLATTYQAGGQFEFTPGWFVGGSLGYEQSWLTGDSAKVSGQAGLAGLMTRYQTGPWLLSANLDGGFGSYQSTRTISVGSQTGTANGSPDVFQVGGRVRAARQMPLAGAMYVEPSLTLGVLDTHLMGYGETGLTSFNLTVHGRNNVTVSATPMVEFGAIRGIDTTHSFRVFADVGMGAYSNSDWSGEANLELAPAGTGSFTVDSKLPSVVGKLKAGVDVQAGGGLHVKFVYSADQPNWTAKIGGRRRDEQRHADSRCCWHRYAGLSVLLLLPIKFVRGTIELVKNILLMPLPAGQEPATAVRFPRADQGFHRPTSAAPRVTRAPCRKPAHTAADSGNDEN